ncbi:ATP-dependent Clp protease ATP-binding protein [Alkalihalobacillus alcalophilus ATCC 27647 = CGMCC 1.3604]|uniref:ATP-dependent Clp protease ATP-binding protein n=1 Tax=Alkalihalobacillus alcalophilus ATCC 27647 = CGMCC 1.3604 TaxID=1218173 RepID=A0A094WFZ2_ALKAL|nr:ATP-dependent Clp protease ATP-binding subunit [Alkalihalobacillus alcalophilus]KGA96689.1 Clp protease ClpX [Alkalihalobacillus alcalophilus ATCC 27647 = CGMCC 1.3604]MED1562379.1 ATP-dependent Clp protease ATP-binding subunit [Alkalihalobacillus alcalophilus]THG89387.1 ATP-dependent Clp protease ATP-binding protein [Alkalihalobacillus alcalophilus ATCC 27647 = CGMCC 1.3604]
MICQNCQQHEATINIRLQYNQEQHSMQLCQKCYQEIQAGNKIPAGFGGGFPNSMGIDDFLESFINGAKQPFQPGQTTQTKTAHRGTGGGGFLDQYGQNLTNAAKAGLIDPVIGRDEEVERVTEILNRRNKNNPVLIGEPGVGKTAIIEGLALKIIEGDVPEKLKNKEVILLDVASLVSNTGIRGQFEERMKQLISELQQKKNVILFIDELHLIVGAGSAEGSMDAGNILKPALARGELQLVGATTLKEYRDIEKDAALERRFQPVTVNEPTVAQATEILKGIRSKYEDYHQVAYSDEALAACVNLSARYIQDRFLPDKAIDLLDEAGSKQNLKAGMTSQDDINKRLKEVATKKEQALQQEDYETAAKLRDEEASLEKKLESNHKQNRPTVDVRDIELIIEKKTGIPVGKIQKNETTKMKNLAPRLAEKVIGQVEAVEKVAKAIRRSRAGLKAKHRPIGSFLFVGPTGVGKTELTKTLAEELFGSKDAMIRLDMSEYMEKHSVSKLIGSPPGYVGHEEAGQLTEKVRRKPYSIILLDEIEKAHPDVQHMFLQILEDGHLTDSQGRKVSFKDTVIIMTSNAGVATKKIEVGFEKSNEAMKEASVLDSLSSFFKPEFLNRFDNIIEFKHLQKDNLIQIVELMLEELKGTVAEQGITIEVSAAAKAKLAELGYHKAFGARPLRRTIQEQLEDRITDLILDEEDVKQITVDVSDGNIIITNQA